MAREAEFLGSHQKGNNKPTHARTIVHCRIYKLSIESAAAAVKPIDDWWDSWVARTNRNGNGPSEANNLGMEMDEKSRRCRLLKV